MADIVVAIVIISGNDAFLDVAAVNSLTALFNVFGLGQEWLNIRNKANLCIGE